MKTMKIELVQQIVSYHEVGSELRDRMNAINDCGYSIKNAIETVASNNIHNKQGFIIVYECEIPDACENEHNKDKSELYEMPLMFKSRDLAIKFIDECRAITRRLNYITVSQVFNLQSSIDERRVEHIMFNDSYLIGWTDLSNMVDEDGSYDNAIMETFTPIHYCLVTLPAPKYLKEEKE